MIAAAMGNFTRFEELWPQQKPETPPGYATLLEYAQLHACETTDEREQRLKIRGFIVEKLLTPSSK